MWRVSKAARTDSSESRVLTVAADAATSTKHAATCTKTKTFSLLLVVPVIRKLPAASPSPWGTRDDGSRGTNASRVAARTASPAPTQSMLESMVRSSARTENRDAYCAKIGRASCRERGEDWERAE